MTRQKIISPMLAEICGIHAGDGHLRKDRNELEISGGIDEKEYYDNAVIPLFNKQFGTDIKGKFFLTKGTYGFTISNPLISSTLTELGFPKGNKSLIVASPSCIMQNESSAVRRGFLRGVFDTDGCVSFSRKTGKYASFKRNRHFYPRILFTTVSKQLCNDLVILCEKEGFKPITYKYQPINPKESTKYKLQIAGKEAIISWMTQVSPKNTSKTSRFEIWKRFGFCPPKTTYEQRTKILKGELNPHQLYGPVV